MSNYIILVIMFSLPASLRLTHQLHLNSNSIRNCFYLYFSAKQIIPTSVRLSSKPGHTPENSRSSSFFYETNPIIKRYFCDPRLVIFV
jgi:hypothetical protein